MYSHYKTFENQIPPKMYSFENSFASTMENSDCVLLNINLPQLDASYDMGNDDWQYCAQYTTPIAPRQSPIECAAPKLEFF